MAGEVVYPSRESYLALGQIAGPVLAAGRQLDIEWEVQRKDGSTFVCRMIAKTLDAADPQQGTVWIVEDITDRRRHADEAARLLREQEAIVGSASIGIVFIKDRRIVRCNRRYEEMYGYAPGELDGQPASIIYPGAAEFEGGQVGVRGRCAAARLHAAWAAPAQGRQHVLEPRRRPRDRPAQPAQGLGLDGRGHHRAASRRGRAAARARRAAGSCSTTSSSASRSAATAR
jgi:PAS domain-containing protein